MSEPEPNWPRDLDAVAAAPAHHRLLLENDAVRVLETRIEPGEVVPLHTHQWPAAYYIVAPGQFVRRDDRGNITLDSRAAQQAPRAGQAVWAPPMGPHTLQNVGTTPIHIVSVEVKSRAGAQARVSGAGI